MTASYILNKLTFLCVVTTILQIFDFFLNDVSEVNKPQLVCMYTRTSLWIASKPTTELAKFVQDLFWEDNMFEEAWLNSHPAFVS